MEKNRSFATRDAIGPHAPTRKEIGRSTPFLGLTLGLLLLAGCADSVPSSSSTRYDGVYRLSATPIPPSSPDPRCAPFAENVVVHRGRLDFVTRGTDTWHGTVDADGHFDGGVVLDGRRFRLTSGIDVPGVFGDSSDNRCQWHYAFQYEGTAEEVPTD